MDPSLCKRAAPQASPSANGWACGADNRGEAVRGFTWGTGTAAFAYMDAPSAMILVDKVPIRELLPTFGCGSLTARRKRADVWQADQTGGEPGMETGRVD